MALLANINRDSKRRPKPFTAMDFAWDGKAKDQHMATTDDEIYALLRKAFPPEDN